MFGSREAFIVRDCVSFASIVAVFVCGCMVKCFLCVEKTWLDYITSKKLLFANKYVYFVCSVLIDDFSLLLVCCYYFFFSHGIAQTGDVYNTRFDFNWKAWNEIWECQTATRPFILDWITGSHFFRLTCLNIENTKCNEIANQLRCKSQNNHSFHFICFNFSLFISYYLQVMTCC